MWTKIIYGASRPTFFDHLTDEETEQRNFKAFKESPQWWRVEVWNDHLVIVTWVGNAPEELWIYVKDGP